MIPIINKQDNFELIRDKISEILAAETVSQQTLAADESLDPDDFVFDVYAERINPWDALTDAPIVNVWFDRAGFGKGGSNSSTRQNTTSRFNCDIYILRETEETETGQNVGDELASKDVQRVARLVRNILMNDDYYKLSLPNTVKSRWISDITMFQPTSGNQVIQNVMACRVALDVEHDEEMVFREEETIEEVNIKFHHEPDGAVIAELDYVYVEPVED